jgi:hypothetical protein
MQALIAAGGGLVRLPQIKRGNRVASGMRQRRLRVAAAGSA